MPEPPLPPGHCTRWSYKIDCQCTHPGVSLQSEGSMFGRHAASGFQHRLGFLGEVAGKGDRRGLEGVDLSWQI